MGRVREQLGDSHGTAGELFRDSLEMGPKRAGFGRVWEGCKYGSHKSFRRGLYILPCALGQLGQDM